MPGSRAVVGRSTKCDLILSDPSVSRRHAELRAGDAQLQVLDLDSRNGTFVDGVRVHNDMIGPGQEVRFGNLSFVAEAEISGAKTESSDIDTANPAAFADNWGRMEELSAAQRRVFNLLVNGWLEKIIARRLGISYHTVHNHVRRIYQVFHVHSRAELMATYIRQAVSPTRAEWRVR